MTTVPETITDLVPKTITATALFAENGLDPILTEIKRKVDAFEPNLETVSSRKEIASFAYKIAQSKTFLDGLGKDLVAEQKAKIKLVDAERKRARDFLDAEKDRARKPLTDWEAEEAEREEKRRQEMLYLMDWDEALVMDDLFNREREIKRKEAEFARIEEERRQKEESERLAKEQAERDERLKKEAIEQAERDAQAKIEAERQRAMKAEQDAKAAAEKAERDRIAAEERAKLEKEQAIELATRQAEERARLGKETADRKATEEKAAADKLAANKRHQAAINNKILDAFSVLDIPQGVAKAVICAVAKGQIPYMTINY
jgi:colicin import membrane protein